MMLSCTAAVMVVQPGTALPAELPEHEALRAGLEPATCRLGVDNRNRSGPQQEVRRGRELRSDAESNRNGARVCSRSHADNRTAPARDDLVVGAGLPGVEPGPA